MAVAPAGAGERGAVADSGHGRDTGTVVSGIAVTGACVAGLELPLGTADAAQFRVRRPGVPPVRRAVQAACGHRGSGGGSADPRASGAADGGAAAAATTCAPASGRFLPSRRRPIARNRLIAGSRPACDSGSPGAWCRVHATITAQRRSLRDTPKEHTDHLHCATARLARLGCEPRRRTGRFVCAVPAGGDVAHVA
jgi:hypothetical protein